jgi:SAM-dependent methyltransferase
MDLMMLAEATAGQVGELVAIDLGCADGSLTVDRFSEFPSFVRVIGVDRDPAAVQRAQLRRSGRFDFVQIDLESPGFEESLVRHLTDSGLPPRVDLMFSALAVHHLADPINLLRTCRGLLNDSGAVVLRGSDDGSKLAYPDERRLVQQLIESTLSQPRVSDRENGRKMYSQLRKAGFSQISMHVQPKDTSGLNLEQRRNMFLESFSYRRNYLVSRIDAGDHAANEELAHVDRLLGELLVCFEDEQFFYLELAFGAVARF